MKKFALSLLSVLLISCLLFVGCGNQFGKIKKAYEDAGYVQNTEVAKYQDEINLYLTENSKENVSDTHVFIKEGLIPSVAIVIEFKSSASIKEAMEESAMLKGLLQDVQKSDLVNGNCVLIPLSQDAIDVFKSTK